MPRLIKIITKETIFSLMFSVTSKTDVQLGGLQLLLFTSV